MPAKNFMSCSGARKNVILTGMFLLMPAVFALLIATEGTYEVYFAVSAVIASILFLCAASLERSEEISAGREKVLKVILLAWSLLIMAVVVLKTVAILS